MCWSMRMYDFFRQVVTITVPIFVVSTMFNVGLTQKLSEILGYLRNWHFVIRMLLANFILVPALMIALVNITDYDPALQAGLLVLGLCAGAPFLIKLTQTSQNDLALGAAVMMLLMVATVAWVPIVLPYVLEGVAVDAWAIAQSLALQMLLPIAVGMIVVQWMTGFAKTIQPWVAKVGNYTLYIVLGATFIGYFPNLRDIIGTGAILGGTVVLLLAFMLGYLMGDGTDRLQDVGGLGTAQRNTAASLIIATQNFDDPNVLVIISVVNALGIVVLLLIARALSKDNDADLAMV